MLLGRTEDLVEAGIARTISAVHRVLGAGMAIPYPRLGVIDKRTYAEDEMPRRTERHPGNAWAVIATQRRCSIPVLAGD